ncbi:MAG: DNA gyrase/topoisomerase IV subunit A [Bacteroidetes bacterium]|nr:DNA gyrase/topoisomerase IV subunit A [Bacteroidota bacterium]MBU1373039.1 DNA gyrase/topoisomerase IV subunit A [Bacteroidota bacterium]MBU1485482.1 DNA gyrase/topoisomerase IV subunit A [Bacteroidota bacterium]MBU1759929.1 DNA gyrase/topoisomerase IV subunit A [Bacteroidota bacterium]MBU2045903.1 DNA gyrase/topoisomerase IV subunit A [Bacteroidota bacterium]
MEENNYENEETLHNVTPLSGLYENWFLDYASYVILDRAVPHIHDGLKPVQRRILHSLKEMDDGRFNKAANVIGNTMKYHPHGDASIGDAMVQIGQKNLLLDIQGNWGDPITGDSAAAPRYIEARLSKFALEVVFNPDTTEWQSSYDGRNKEPITLPVKFPLLLAQGAEGIAVGLATKVMPHNFIELIDASIEVLKGNRPDIIPDFLTGGMADFSAYNEGQRGGKIRVRAKISELDKKTLVITEIPFSTTTIGLIDSIISANDKGKIKIKKIEDNTAKDVEIVVHLAPGISPDVTIDALYAFTSCEVSISPNTCIIKGDKPHFMSVNDILVESTQYTKNLLKRELEIKLHDLMERIFFSSLLKIFIQEGMYKHSDYENSVNFEEVLIVLHRLFEPFKPSLYREILPEDFKKLIDKPMSSITRFDVKKADEQMANLEKEIKGVKHDLKHLTDYAIAYFERLKEKFGKGRERKTEIRAFDRVEAAQVALANTKFYINKEDGFVGTGLKKDEYVFDCSDLDDVIVFREDGVCLVTKVQDKTFVGKGILHVGVFKKNDERTIYNMVYKDGKTGTAYIKRFASGGVTRDKEYDLTKGSKGSKVLYFTANPNGEAEVINVALKPMSKLRKLTFDHDFAETAIKGRGSQGNILTKYAIKKITLKSKGVSTLAGRKIWYDPIVKRLNENGHGRYLGEFQAEDKILCVFNDGSYELSSFDLTNHFDDKMLRIEKLNPERVYACIHFDGKSKNYYIKRFTFEDLAIGKRTGFISEEPSSKMILLSNADHPIVKIESLKGKSQIFDEQELDLSEAIEVKGLKAQGNKLSPNDVQKVTLISENNNEIEEVEEDIIEDDDDSNGDGEDEKSGNEEQEEVEAKVEKEQEPSEPAKPKFETIKKEEVKAIESKIEEVKEIKTPKEEVKEKTVEAPISDAKPPKKVDFEITNPDDIKLDDKGQLGLF